MIRNSAWCLGRDSGAGLLFPFLSTSERSMGWLDGWTDREACNAPSCWLLHGSLCIKRSQTHGMADLITRSQTLLLGDIISMSVLTLRINFRHARARPAAGPPTRIVIGSPPPNGRRRSQRRRRVLNEGKMQGLGFRI